MKLYSSSPVALFESIRVNRALIISLIRREVLGRYQGSVGGIFWSFLNPILMLAIYTFVFGLIFKARFVGEGDTNINFALALFIGLIVFNLFAECLGRSPSLIMSHVNYVKKVVFPLEILPIITLGTSLFHAAMSSLVWLLFYLLIVGLPSYKILLFPLLMVPIFSFSLGALWLLSSVGVYLRDIGQFIGLLTTALMFLSAIFYPISSIPEKHQYIMYYNPFAVIIDQSRSLLLLDKWPDFYVLGTITIISLLFAWLGFVAFQKLRKGFADVI